MSKQKLDKKCSVENIVVSSGSTAVLYASFKYIYERRQKKIVFVAPCWSMYEVIAKNLGITYDYCFPTNKMTWKHTLEDICNVLDESVGAIVVATPGNPTGLMFSEEYLQAVYRRCVELDIDMILDEAYYGLSDQMNRFTQINCTQDNLIIIRTMSKYYCLSGARVGFAISSFKYIEGLANNIKAMNLVGSKIDQFVALQFLKQGLRWTEGIEYGLKEVRGIELPRGISRATRHQKSLTLSEFLEINECVKRYFPDIPVFNHSACMVSYFLNKQNIAMIEERYSEECHVSLCPSFMREKCNSKKHINISKLNNLMKQRGLDFVFEANSEIAKGYRVCPSIESFSPAIKQRVVYYISCCLEEDSVE